MIAHLISYYFALDLYAELFKRIQPADYLSRFLQEGYRPDGRRAQEFRKPALNAGAYFFGTSRMDISGESVLK